jgi:hypothetical protein
MNKLLPLLLMLFGYLSSAQIFTPLKLSVGTGYAENRFGKGIGKGGVLFAEPAYRFSENLSIGFRIEAAAITRGVSGSSNNNLSSIVSFTLNTQHYFNNNYARPFIGFGAGVYRMASVSSMSSSPETQNAGAGTSFGFYPRVGIDVGHFNFTVDFNVIPSSDVPRHRKVTNNYLALKAGFSIGGGTGKRNRNLR